jgi:enoyl-CoA hydratase/carnithine racemase
MGSSGVRTEDAPIPTACAINGYCLGGAMELAMVCDVRVASENAVFGMPEIKVGIPSVLDAALLQQHVGRHSRTALAAQKRLFETWQNSGLEESIRASVDEFANVFEEEETRATIRRYAGGLRRKRS